VGTSSQTVEDDIDLQLSSEKNPESVPFSHYTPLKLPQLKISHEDINPPKFSCNIYLNFIPNNVFEVETGHGYWRRIKHGA